MNEPKPDWYERLASGPFARKTVSGRLMDETERALRGRLGGRARRTAGRIALAAVVVVAIAAFVMAQADRLDWTPPWKGGPVHAPVQTQPEPPAESPGEPPGDTSDVPQPTDDVPIGQDGVIPVQNGNEVGAGPLSSLYTATAGVRLGDSQEQVLAALGEPDDRSQLHSTPFPLWRYDDIGLSVAFYRRGETEPPGGVVIAELHDKATAKLSDRRMNVTVGIGDPLARLLELYRPVYGTPADGPRNVWLRGAVLGEDGKYRPVLQLSVKDGRITGIRYDNGDEDPNAGRVADTPGGTVVRAVGQSRYGELRVEADGPETIEPLGAPSCIGAESDLHFSASYKTVFERKDGTEAELTGGEPIKSLIYPSTSLIALEPLPFDSFEAFPFIPAYMDCHGLTFHLYGVTDKTAFAFRFELNGGQLSDTYYVLPSTKPQVEDGMLVTYGGGSAGNELYTKTYFRPDPANRKMVLVKTETMRERPPLE